MTKNDRLAFSQRGLYQEVLGELFVKTTDQESFKSNDWATRPGQPAQVCQQFAGTTMT